MCPGQQLICDELKHVHVQGLLTWQISKMPILKMFRFPIYIDTGMFSSLYVWNLLSYCCVFGEKSHSRVDRQTKHSKVLHFHPKHCHVNGGLIVVQACFELQVSPSVCASRIQQLFSFLACQQVRQCWQRCSSQSIIQLVHQKKISQPTFSILD